MKLKFSKTFKISLIAILLVLVVHSRLIDEPSISSISVNSGSIQGGTQITIYGANFNSISAKNRVVIGNNYDCSILADGTKINSITCQTGPGFDPQNRYNQYVKVQVQGYKAVTCPNCQFSYRQDRTPFIEQIYPRNALGNDLLWSYGYHRITNLGDGRSANLKQFQILIGDQTCIWLDVDQLDSIDGNRRNPINCNVSYLQTAGQYSFLQHNTPGKSRNSLRTLMTSLFTGKNYTMRVVSNITKMPYHAGGSLGHTIDIKGTGFSTFAENYTCTVAGQECKIISAMQNNLKVQIPAYDTANVKKGQLDKDSTDSSTRQMTFLGSQGFKYSRYLSTKPEIYDSSQNWLNKIKAGTLPTGTFKVDEKIVTELSSPSIYGDQPFVEYIRGYFFAPVDGSYRFTGQADDRIFMKMSTVANNSNSANLQTLIDSGYFYQIYNPYTKVETTEKIQANKTLAYGYYYMEIISINHGGLSFYKISVQTPKLNQNPIINPSWQVQELIIEPKPDSILRQIFTVTVPVGTGDFTLSYLNSTFGLETVTISQGVDSATFKSKLGDNSFVWNKLAQYVKSVSLQMKDSSGQVTTDVSSVSKYIYTVQLSYRQEIPNLIPNPFSVVITPVQNHSAPLSGTFTLTVDGQTSGDLSVTSSWYTQNFLRQKYRDMEIYCYSAQGVNAKDSFHIIIQYLGMNPPTTIQPDVTKVTGGLTNTIIWNKQTNTRIIDRQFNMDRQYFNVVPFDFLRTASSTSSLNIHVNGVPMVCSDCSYQFDSTITGTVTSSSLATNVLSFSITVPASITYTKDEIQVSVNGVFCLNPITQVSAGSYSCTLPYLVAGNNVKPKIHLKQIGVLDSSAVTGININLNNIAMTPAQCSPGGGLEAIISGQGFSQNNLDLNEVKICGKIIQKFISVSNTQIKFMIPSGDQTACTSNSSVTVNGVTQSLTFSYNSGLAPVVTSLSKTSSSPIKKSTIAIHGSGFGTITDTTVKLCQTSSCNPDERNYDLSVINVTSTEINAILGGGKTGDYVIVVKVNSNGYSIPDTNSNFAYRIYVEGVSPSNGPLGGGYNITITGKNFGPQKNSNHVFISSSSINAPCKILQLTQTSIACQVSSYTLKDMSQATDMNVVVTGRIIQESSCAAGGNCHFTYTQDKTPRYTIDNTTHQYTKGAQVSFSFESQDEDLNNVIITVGSVLVTDVTVGNPYKFRYPQIANGIQEIKIKIKNTTLETYAYLKYIPNTLYQNSYPAFNTISPYQANNLSYTQGSNIGAIVQVNGNGFVTNPNDKGWQIYTPCYGGQKLNVLSITPSVITLQMPPKPSNETYCKVNVTYGSSVKTWNFNYVDPAAVTWTQNSGDTFTLVQVNQTGKAIDKVEFVFLDSQNNPTSSVYPFDVTKIASTNSSTITPSNGKVLPAGTFSVRVHIANYGFASVSPLTFLKSLGTSSTGTSQSVAFTGGKVITINGDGFVTIEPKNNDVRICGLKADVISATLTSLEVMIPPLITNITQTNYQLTVDKVVTGVPYADNPSEAAKGLDQDIDSVYKSPNSDCYLGYDFGENSVINLKSLRFMPTQNWANPAQDLDGALFQGTNDSSSTWTQITKVDIGQVHSAWNYWQRSANQQFVFRYVRFRHNDISLTPSYCQLTGLQFTGKIYSTLPVTAVSDYPCDVSINRGGSVQSISNFAITYSHSKTAVVTGISPLFGPSIGGTVVTITGSNFGTNIQVIIDGIACANPTSTSTQIICTTGKRSSPPSGGNSFVVKSDGNLASLGTQPYLYIDRWSDTDTWGGQAVPRQGDSVIVPKGMTLLVDESTPVLYSVIVQGKIKFSDEKDMTFDTFYFVINGGQFQAGTQDKPYTKRLTFTLHGNLYDKQLPTFGNKMIGCLNCKFNMHGKVRNVTWTDLDETADAGDTIIHLTQEVDWQPGQIIAIAASSFDHYQTEEATIKTVTIEANQTTTVTLEKPLRYRHFSGIQSHGGKTFYMRAEVGLLTRNIKVQGDSNSLDTKYGSHLMLTGKQQTGLVGKISYSEFTHCGQPKIIGRYCTHFHMAGQVPQSYVRGISVHHSFARILTIHGTHFLLVEKNVGFHVQGHNIFVEDGIETNNIIQDNLVMSSISSLTLLQSDTSVASYWITNPYNIVRRNRAAGGDFYGFWYEIMQHPSGPSSTEDICPMGMQIKQSQDNIAHSNKRFGLRIFQLSARKFPCIAPQDEKLEDPYFPILGNDPNLVNQAIQSVFENYTLWKNQECGFLGQQLGFTTIKNFKTIDSRKGGMQFHKTNYTKQLVVATDCVMVGYSDGNGPQDFSQYQNARGFIASRTDGLLGQNLYFKNFKNTMTPLQSCSECFQVKLWVTGGKTTSFKNIQYQNIEGNYIFWEQHRRQIFIDLDGTLTKNITDNLSIPVTFPSSITPYRESLAALDGCVNASLTVWNESLYCDNRVVLRSILLTNADEKINFQGIHMKVRRLADPFQNVSAYVEEKFSKQIMVIIKPKSLDIPNSWAMPFASGFYYNVHWKLGIDFLHVSIAPSRLWEQDEGVVLRFNYSQYRQKFLIGKYYKKQIMNNMTGSVANVSLIDPNTCENGQFSVDMENQYLFVCVSGRNKTIREWIDVTGIKCKDACPLIDPLPNRDSRWRFWSVDTDWTDGIKKPVAGQNFTLPYQWMMVLDQVPPKFDNLTINGILRFSWDIDITLEANLIWIRQGELQIGNQTHRYEKNAKIILHGNKSSPTYALDPDLAGNKMLVVSGALLAYGKQNSYQWTRLAQTAQAGTNTLKLINGSKFSFKDGDKLAVAPSYDGRTQFEQVTVKSVSGDTVTLYENLAYEHYGASMYVVNPNNTVGIFDPRTSVARINRNIKITNDGDSWGCRVVIAGILNPIQRQEMVGYARLYGVQINDCGQYDTTNAGLRLQNLVYRIQTTTDPNDNTKQVPRNVTRTEIVDSSINNCNGMCAYADNINNVTFNNNVFFKGRKFLFLVLNVDHYNFTNNVLIGAQKRQEVDTSASHLAEDTACYQQYITVPNNLNVQVTSNLAQGSQGEGFVFPYTPCATFDTYSFKNNTAGSCEIGFMYEKKDGETCLAASGMIAYSCQIGLQANPPGTHTNVTYTNGIFADNGRGITLRYAHEIDDNVIQLKDSYFVGFSRPDCASCYAYGKNSYCNGGYAIRMFSATISGQTFPLKKPAMIHDVICTQESYDFKAFLQNVVFENYYHSNTSLQPFCNNMAVFKRHVLASDGVAGHMLSNSPCLNCEKQAWAYFEHPNSAWRGWFGGCGELDCTGPNNYFVYDTDGKFTNTNVPSQILANNSIIGNGQGCQAIQEINGHWCHSENLAILEYESTAVDFNKRIMWPVYLKYDGGNWTSATNGWRQWQWNGNQPLNLRLARFWSVVRLHKTYNLTYSGEPPAKSRFQIQHRVKGGGNQSDYVIIRTYYPIPNSLNVFIKTSPNGAKIRVKPHIINGTSAFNLSQNISNCGAHNYFYENSTIEFLVSGRNCQVHIEKTSFLQLSVRLEISVWDFYKNDGPSTFINNICAFLGIDTGRMKIVGVRQGSSIINTQIVSDQPTTAAQNSDLNTIQTNFASGVASNSINVGASIISYNSTAYLFNEDGTTYQQENSNDNPNKNNVPLIIGIAVGVFLIVTIAGVLITATVIYVKRKRIPIHNEQSIIPDTASCDFEAKSHQNRGKRDFIKPEDANWGDVSSVSD